MVSKKEGSFRFILTLKKLNEFIEDQHFKIEDIKTALKLVTLSFFMASIDLRDAYYSIPMHKSSKKICEVWIPGDFVPIYMFTIWALY